MKSKLINQRKIEIFIQCLASFLTGIGICAYCIEERKWVDFGSLMLIDIIFCFYFVAIFIGSIIWSLYLLKFQKKMATYTHIVLTIGLVCRIVFMVEECCFNGDVPAYSILIFGLPSIIAFLAEINLLLCYIKSCKIKWLFVEANMIISSIVAVWYIIGIVLFISEGGFSEYLPTLVYIGIAMTFLNIDFAEWRKK